jgi:hypothetical protein
MRNSGTVSIGDRFHRAGRHARIYQVTAVRSSDWCPPHALLVSESKDRDTITISVMTLLDVLHWRPVAAEPVRLPPAGSARDTERPTCL